MEPIKEEEDRPATGKVKQERSEAQKATLLRAREKAIEVRKSNAELRKKEKQVLKEKEKVVKSSKIERIENEYDKLMKSQQPPSEMPTPPPNSDDEDEDDVIEEEIVKKPKKKFKRRVVVVQSSSSEEEEEIEVRLPKTKPAAKPDEKIIKYDRTYKKLFSID